MLPNTFSGEVSKKCDKKCCFCEERSDFTLTKIKHVRSEAQNEYFSKQNLQGATAASFCRILDREEALDSSNAVL